MAVSTCNASSNFIALELQSAYEYVMCQCACKARLYMLSSSALSNVQAKQLCTIELEILVYALL